MDETGQGNNLSEIRPLSERQRSCLLLVAQGKTSKEIGRLLSLSPSTVDSHIRIAIERLGSRDRMSAARQVFFDMNAKNAVLNSVSEPIISRSMWVLPPLGGVVNRLSARRRMFHIIQIALFGIMGMTAAVVTIAGLVNLFGR